MTTMREKRIEGALVRGVERLGGIAPKWGIGGGTDRIVMLDGCAWFVELKNEEGDLEPSQIIMHEKMRDCDVQPIILTSLRAVDLFLRTLDYRARNQRLRDIKKQSR
jgi:hypothetical protein